MPTIPAINNHDVVCLVNTTDPAGWIVDGSIDGNSIVSLETSVGDITVRGKVDGGSQVTLKAPNGNVTIGTAGSDDDKKIDGNSSVTIVARGSVTFGSKIHKATVDVTAHGGVTVPLDIDTGARIRVIADGAISFGDKVDGSSRVDAVSNRGAITLQKKVGGGSKVWFTAASDIRIGQIGGDGDKRIDTDSFVSATAGGLIDLGGTIDNSHTVVDFAACRGVSIGQDVKGGATVRLASSAGSITVGGHITDSGTSVTSFPAGALTSVPQNGATKTETSWIELGPLCQAAPRNGSWWENWGQSFGYVVPERIVPHSLPELVDAVKTAFNPNRRGDITPVKAVGGGWSFTDASLPIRTAAEVDTLSIARKGETGQQDLHGLVLGLPDRAAVPMDLVPEAVTLNVAASTTYDHSIFRQITMGGAQLASPASNARIIDTRQLCSSLQCEFPDIRTTMADPAGRPLPSNEILFHVEAGITIADLQQLLDHQHPRLALHATGGSPGATLAGTLSTATHGGEFNFVLLVDEVRAIHLLGPGGEQWWIEGDVPVAEPSKLLAKYGIDTAHFIGGPSWSGIPGLTPQDVLKAVAVSMGTMGVIYSVVLHVVEQFGIHQITTSLTWQDLLTKAPATEAQLQMGDPAANQRVLGVILDGQKNGTGIQQADNIYADLAINPINHDCWIINRSVTTAFPDDADNKGTGIGDYLSALSFAFGKTNDSNGVMSRVLEFLGWQKITDLFPNVFSGGPETTSAAPNLASYIMGLPDLLVGAAATAAVQAVANTANDNAHPERGLQFFGDLLSGVFHAMQGTRRGRDVSVGTNADSTAVSYKVGAIGWPDSGVPGRGFEVALDSTNAFTFLQTVLFDVLTNVMRNSNKPLLGYISIRVCPQTQTLVGMQQYSPFSVMIEVVAYRSPEANDVFDEMLTRTLAFSGPGPRPLLHWGLENQVMDASHLAASPLGSVYKGAMTRLDAFRAVRSFLRNGHPPVFDNAFSARMGL